MRKREITRSTEDYQESPQSKRQPRDGFAVAGGVDAVRAGRQCSLTTDARGWTRIYFEIGRITLKGMIFEDGASG